jgi:hypothetical protein
MMKVRVTYFIKQYQPAKIMMIPLKAMKIGKCLEQDARANYLRLTWTLGPAFPTKHSL